VNHEILEYAKASGKPFLEFVDDDEYSVRYNKFYDEIIGS
jgi:starch synthase